MSEENAVSQHWIRIRMPKRLAAFCLISEIEYEIILPNTIYWHSTHQSIEIMHGTYIYIPYLYLYLIWVTVEEKFGFSSGKVQVLQCGKPVLGTVDTIRQFSVLSSLICNSAIDAHCACQLSRVGKRRKATTTTLLGCDNHATKTPNPLKHI